MFPTASTELMYVGWLDKKKSLMRENQSGRTELSVGVFAAPMYI